MIESVAGKISAAPTPVIARIAISAVAESTSADAARADAEDDEPEGEDAAPPEAVAEAPGGEQQPGEHQRVGVDDPLELAGRRVAGPGRASGSPR